jgi:hypothetical protein
VAGSSGNMLDHPESRFSSRDLMHHCAVSASKTCWKKVSASAGVSHHDTAVTYKLFFRSSRHAEPEELNQNSTSGSLKCSELRDLSDYRCGCYCVRGGSGDRSGCAVASGGCW